MRIEKIRRKKKGEKLGLILQRGGQSINRLRMGELQEQY